MMEARSGVRPQVSAMQTMISRCTASPVFAASRSSLRPGVRQSGLSHASCIPGAAWGWAAGAGSAGRAAATLSWPRPGVLAQSGTTITRQRRPRGQQDRHQNQQTNVKARFHEVIPQFPPFRVRVDAYGKPRPPEAGTSSSSTIIKEKTGCKKILRKV